MKVALLGPLRSSLITNYGPQLVLFNPLHVSSPPCVMPSGAMRSCFWSSCSESQTHSSLSPGSPLMLKFACTAWKKFESNASLWIFSVSLSSIPWQGTFLSLPPGHVYQKDLTCLWGSHQTPAGLSLSHLCPVSFRQIYVHAAGSQTF